MKKTAQAVLDALDFPDGELSILIIDDRQIEEFNRNYLNREGPTNVIAFPMREGAFSNITPKLLGDVVISVETAKKEGASAGITTEERIVQLLVHGILHLWHIDLICELNPCRHHLQDVLFRQTIFVRVCLYWL